MIGNVRPVGAGRRPPGSRSAAGKTSLDLAIGTMIVLVTGDEQ
jgi:hypothetical protein